MKHFISVTALVAALAAAANTQAATCTAGQIDASFGPSGSAGFVQISPWLPAASGNFEGLVYGADGNLYAPTTVATGGSGGYEGLVRLSRSGRIDRTYAGFGFASPGLQPSNTDGNQTANLTQDAAGNTAVAMSGSGVVSVTRFLPDGSPDVSFGTAGAMSFPLINAFAIVGITAAADGSLFIAAGAKNAAAANPQLPVVIKLTPAGALDSSFGSGGYAYFFPASYTWTNSLGRATDILLLASGQMIVVGRFRIPGASGMHYQAFATRLLSNGQVDVSFGTAGDTIFDLGDTTNARARKIALQADGKYALTGSTDNLDGSGGRVAVFRINADGSPDAAFGSGGYVTTGTVNGAFGINLALQDNGKIVVGVQSWADAAQTQGVANVFRYLTDGTLDTAFGSGGMATLTPAGSAAGITSTSGATVVMSGSTRIATLVSGTKADGTGAVWLTSVDTGHGHGCH